ncbi:hypothetical protein HHI36_022419 [Cryptolaemus montrouzieri]|uniref:Uncharacterized protein n=1 Tax=Cryptolaemus montrouzieri TaxID=559131 RepID=A0ABD2MZX1_9CUCU
MEQTNRQSNIEIQNVPEKTHKNLSQLVTRFGNHLDLQVNGTSIDYVTRVPSALANKPKNIILRFLSKSNRDNFLATYKAKRLSADDKRPGLRVYDVSERLYINELSTIENNILCKEVRGVAKSKQYEFVWTQKCSGLIITAVTSEATTSAATGAVEGRPDIDSMDVGIAAFISKLAAEIRSLRKSVNFFRQITDFKARIAKFGDVISKVNKIERENEKLKQEVCTLNIKIRNMEQTNRQSNIEIQNVPEKHIKISQLVTRFGNHLDLQVNGTSIDYVTRVPSALANKPKNIILRFLSKSNRDNFLATYKAKRLSADDKRPGLRVYDVSERLYINELSTIENNILCKEVRGVAKSKQYEFVWTQKEIHDCELVDSAEYSIFGRDRSSSASMKHVGVEFL